MLVFVTIGCQQAEARLLLADNEPARPAVKVVESAEAQYMGIVFLIACVLPLGVLMILDVVKLVKWRNKSRK